MNSINTTVDNKSGSKSNSNDYEIIKEFIMLMHKDGLHLDIINGKIYCTCINDDAKKRWVPVIKNYPMLFSNFLLVDDELKLLSIESCKDNENIEGFCLDDIDINTLN